MQPVDSASSPSLMDILFATLKHRKRLPDSTTIRTPFKTLDEYSLSHRTNNLYLTKITPTASVKQASEVLVDACLKRLLADVEQGCDRYSRSCYTSNYERNKGEVRGAKSKKRLIGLQRISEENKRILCYLTQHFCEAIENKYTSLTKDSIGKPFVFWSLHGLDQNDLINDSEFIDNLVISIVNKHLRDLSIKKNQQREDSALEYVKNFLQSDNIYYASGIYQNDKNIKLTEIQVYKATDDSPIRNKQIKAKSGEEFKINVRFHIEIEKAEDSKAIQKIKAIKNQILHDTVYKNQVSIWINACIKNIQQDLESICLTQEDKLASDLGASTNITDDHLLQKNKLMLENLKSLSVIIKDSLCNFVAYFYEALISLKKDEELQNQKTEHAKNLWEVSTHINGELIDKLVIGFINYYLHKLLDPAIGEQALDKTEDFIKEELNDICNVSVQFTDKGIPTITKVDFMKRKYNDKLFNVKFYIKDAE